MTYFERIAEHNKSLIKPLDSDMIYYSELNTFFSPNAFRSLSVKFVVEQEIVYKSEGKEFKVGGGQFLLACKHSDANAFFESKQTVRSICIDICADSFAEAYAVITGKDEDFDNYLAQYFAYPQFFENVNRVQTGSIDQMLKSLLYQIQLNELDCINKEWFLDLTEKIIYKEYGNYHALKNIHAAKPSTRKEIFQRLQTGREYMDENFHSISEIKEVAKYCLLSEYHFFRCFRQAFGTTPFHYLATKKLAFAKERLTTSNDTVAAVAAACNYPDVFTFSKAFKRQFGYAPGTLKKLRS